METQIQNTESPYGRLMGASALLVNLFEETTRPSLRWLRDRQKDKSIPSIRIGRRVFFDPEQVKAALAKRTVRAR